MPVGTDGRWYPDPLTNIGADLGITYLAAAATTTYAFKREGFLSIQAALKTHEFYKTGLTGSNNDFIVIALASNTSPLTIALVDPSANSAALSVSKATNAISVNLATNSSGTIISTGNDVIAALNSDPDSHPYVKAILAPGNDGSGVVTALSAQGLAGFGGSGPTIDVTLETSFDGSNWASVAAFSQVTGVGADAIKQFSGLGPDLRWSVVVAGTSPEIVFSIDAEALP